MIKRKKAQDEFLKTHPIYKETSVLDKLRKTDYKRLDKQKHVYLDYTGGNLYAESQIKKHLDSLKSQTFGNPHSTNPTSLLSTQRVEETRRAVLDFFNAGDDYFCVFTANASGALKLVGESYPFDENAFMLLSIDNHNSVNGIREFAKKKGAKFLYNTIDPDTLKLNREELIKNLDDHSTAKNKLFAFPAQSNVSGVKHPLDLIELAQNKGWDVLLDTAAYVPSNKLNLQKVKPDFASISFYKIFGYPTGLGCLLIKKTKFDKLVKPWYAGGTVSLASAVYDAHYLMPNHERFEEGTINYLDIPAIKIGLDHIQKIGVETINKRVQALTAWTMNALDQLKHDNGNKLVKVFGTKNMSERGGTLVMNFFGENGNLHPFGSIEAEANKENISVRTGCFCNPGLDETNYHITEQELQSYFGQHTTGNYYDMVEFTGKLRGAVRISFGLASNFKDAYTFVKFASKFLNKRA